MVRRPAVGALRGLVPPGNGSPDGSSPDGGWSGAGATNASAGSPYEPWGAGRPPHRRNLVWALVAAGAAALALILVLLGVAYASRTGDIYVFKMPIGSRPDAEWPAEPLAVDRSVGPVHRRRHALRAWGSGSASCITGAECYDSAKKQVACGGRTPGRRSPSPTCRPGSTPPTPPRTPRCARSAADSRYCWSTAKTVSDQGSIDVLVPRANNRTYRCLAGKGPNALSGPQLRKSR